MSLHRAHLPGTPARNGLPEPIGYTYQGTGEDQGPHLGDEQLAPYRVAYEQWLPAFTRGTRTARTGDPCPHCTYKRGGVNCRAICGGVR